MPLLLTISCSSKSRLVFTCLILAYPGSPGQNPESCKTFVVVRNQREQNIARGACMPHVLNDMN